MLHKLSLKIKITMYLYKSSEKYCKKRAKNTKKEQKQSKQIKWTKK